LLFLTKKQKKTIRDLCFSYQNNKKLKIRESLLFLTKKTITKTIRESFLFLSKIQKTKNNGIFAFLNKKKQKTQ
jgi:hypothetical protein